MSIRTELGRFFKGFGYAAKGIAYCVRTQRNFRFHMGAAVGVAFASCICRITAAEMLAVIFAVAGVLSLEALNTALESSVDLSSKGKRSELAGRAKDCAAASVLLFSIGAACTGLFIFLRKGRLAVLFEFFSDPLRLCMAVAYLLLWFLWVFVLFRKKKR